MIGTMKGALVFGAAGAVVMGVAEVAAAALLQLPTPAGSDIATGGLAGGAVSAAVFWIYKAKVDQLEREKANKTDLEPIHEALRDIKADVRYLVRNRPTGDDA